MTNNHWGVVFICTGVQCIAQERIANQLPNTERIARSNVVFCSLWDYSETERQVQKALNNVKERLRENDS
ncbi:hypothetical protein niasHT_013170 [Heterodera trifolii]|uniref:Uncharacterized protein n=1 Tax=Heterodera trifolii TaxID=157864 RepID=A0ABD2KTW2_9BILA